MQTDTNRSNNQTHIEKYVNDRDITKHNKFF